MINLYDFKKNYQLLLESKENLKLCKDISSTTLKIKDLIPKIINNSHDIQYIDEAEFFQMVNLLESVSNELQEKTKDDKLIAQISEVKETLLCSRTNAEKKLPLNAAERKINIGLNMCFFSDINCVDHNGAITNSVKYALEHEIPFATSRALFKGTALPNQEMLETTSLIEGVLLNKANDWVIFEGISPEMLLFLPNSILKGASDEEQLKALDFNPSNLKKISIVDALRESQGSIQPDDFINLFSNKSTIQTILSFHGHGGPTTVAGINSEGWKKILSFLDQRKCKTLTVTSCSSAGESSLMALPSLSNKNKFEEGSSDHPYHILVHSVGDFVTKSSSEVLNNLKTYFNDLTQFLEGTKGQTIEQLKRTIQHAENGESKGITNANRVHFSSSKETITGFTPVGEKNKEAFSLTGLEIKTNKLNHQEMIQIENKNYLLVQPSIVPLSLNFKISDPLVISMLPGQAQHLLKEVNLTTLAPDDYLQQNLDLHTFGKTRCNKGFFIGELKSLSKTFQEVAFLINYLGDIQGLQGQINGIYIYKEENKYYLQRIGEPKEEISAAKHAILMKQFEAATRPSDKALKYGSDGQEEVGQFKKSLGGSKFYSDRSSLSQSTFKELDALFKNCSIQSIEAFIESHAMTKNEIEEFVFLLLRFQFNEVALELVKKHNLDPNMVNYESTPLLVFSVENKHPAFVNYLLENNVNLNAKNALGITALLSAFQVNNEPLIIQLLNHPHIDASCFNKNGVDPVFMAIKNGKKDILNLLKQKGGFLDGMIRYRQNWLKLFPYFLQTGNRQAIELLLNEKVDPYHGKPSGLIQAIYQRDLSLVIKMIEIYGPPVADDEGHEPLVEAALRSSPEILKFLLKVGNSEINKVDKLGINAMLAALYSGSQEKIEILKKERALLIRLPVSESELIRSIIYKLYLTNNTEQLQNLRDCYKIPEEFDNLIYSLTLQPRIIDYFLTHNLIRPKV